MRVHQNLLKIVILLFFAQAIEAVLIDKLYNEANILELVKKVLPDNPVIIEAGAYHGNTTNLISQMWPKAKIYTFEPNPDAYKTLTETTKNLSNVISFSMGLGETDEQGELYLCSNHPPACSYLMAVAHLPFIFEKEKLKTPMISVDSLKKQNNNENIDFLYLDAEGYEAHICKGAENALKDIKAIYTVVNFTTFRQDNTIYQDLKKYLEKFDFKEIWKHTNSSYQGKVLFIKKSIKGVANE